MHGRWKGRRGPAGTLDGMECTVQVARATSTAICTFPACKYHPRQLRFIWVSKNSHVLMAACQISMNGHHLMREQVGTRANGVALKADAWDPKPSTLNPKLKALVPLTPDRCSTRVAAG